MRDVVDHLDEDPIDVIPSGTPDEAAINLEIVCDKILQIRERRKPGSEIVQRKTKTLCPKGRATPTSNIPP